MQVSDSISIHASTWEATVASSSAMPTIKISIHASTWEATRKHWPAERNSRHFNSRLYMRGNRTPYRHRKTFPYFNSRLYMRGNFVSIFPARRISISIHASTWEATATTLSGGIVVTISIHASTWEATWSMRQPLRKIVFQFTPLHERQRVWHRKKWRSIADFNSRLYMRGNCKNIQSFR